MKVLPVAIALVVSTTAIAADPLPSWNEGPAKKSIVDFVASITTPASRDFVPPAERIATFDNDGTLWAEQPLYFQLLFALDQVKLLAPQHPEWKDREPFASLLKGDTKAALAGGEHALLEIIAATHLNTTTEEFERRVQDWIATARHPASKKPYTSMVYQPMLELLAYLRANGFKTFIVSGGGIEFMRPWVEQIYGIPPEQVIGSSAKTKFELRDGVPVLVRLPEINFVDDKEGKPVGINLHIGRRPIAAFGNSDGDLQMLQWTCSGPGRRFCLYVHHTDATREWAYDKGSPIGALDKGMTEAKAKGWTVVSMKDDWKRIFRNKVPMQALLVSTGVVALAEIGDKTQLLAFLLAARFRRPVPIVLGILLATLLNHGLAGALGAWITANVDQSIMRWVLGLSFLGMAAWTLIPDEIEGEEANLARRMGVFGATFVTFFLAEMGDKTQVATVALAAHYGTPVTVILGTTLGMLIADVPAVFVGEKLATRIPMKLVHSIAAAIFAVLGGLTLLGVGARFGV